MKKLTGEKAAEQLYNWMQLHRSQFGNEDIHTIGNQHEWLPVAADLANHLADHPHADITAWPWQARALCSAQIMGWMAIALSPQCALQPLPIDKRLLHNTDLIVSWLMNTQIAPMSVFSIPES